MYYPYIKRLLDIIVSLLGIITLLPLFFIIIVSLKLFQGGHPFFYQKRPGKHNKIFKVIKFKTMNDKTDAQGNLLPDVERLTKIGRFLRATSLDEIPQLFNVLKGDMSLVGPRPLMVRYLPLYSEKQARRHNVQPGITGLAQVKGRNSISWKEKFEYDTYYVDNVSFFLDIKILLLTVKKVLLRSDINSAENLTMEPFNGNN